MLMRRKESKFLFTHVARQSCGCTIRESNRGEWLGALCAEMLSPFVQCSLLNGELVFPNRFHYDDEINCSRCAN